MQVIDNQSYLGQQVLNVYYFRVTAALGLSDGYLSDFNGWFDSTILPAVCGVQIQSLSHVSREWRNLTNGTDLFTDGTVVPGGLASLPAEAMPSYVSLGFMLQRGSLSTRNGYKRIAGLVESSITGNTFSGTHALITAIESALAANITLGLVSVASPVIVKRPINPPVSSYVFSNVVGCSFRTVGTQNSRKAGRGV